MIIFKLFSFIIFTFLCFKFLFTLVGFFALFISTVFISIWIIICISCINCPPISCRLISRIIMADMDSQDLVMVRCFILASLYFEIKLPSISLIVVVVIYLLLIFHYLITLNSSFLLNYIILYWFPFKSTLYFLIFIIISLSLKLYYFHSNSLNFHFLNFAIIWSYFLSI